MDFSFLFIGRELTTWPANNCLQISVLLQIIFCSCVFETTLLCENGGSVPRAGREWFDIFSWTKQQWSNDKTIIELGYRKISWFVTVSLINYLPQPSALANNWSARHWQLTIFCSTSSNCRLMRCKRNNSNQLMMIKFWEYHMHNVHNSLLESGLRRLLQSFFCLLNIAEYHI